MLTDASLAHATLQVRLALTAIDLLCAQPTWLRGIVIKAAPGPVRDAIQSRLEHALTLHRVAPTTSAEHLFGGLDTAQTLAVAHLTGWHSGLASHCQFARPDIARPDRTSAVARH